MFQGILHPFLNDTTSANSAASPLANSGSNHAVNNDGAQGLVFPSAADLTAKQLSNSYRLLEGKVRQLSQELDKMSNEKELAYRKKNQLANRMQALLDFLPGGVIVLDPSGMIIEANPAAVRLLECKLVGKLWRTIINQCFSPKSDDGLEVSTASGKRISLSTSSLDSFGQIILLTDQTETRKLQESVSRNERLSALGEMVSALAHQIRTPLSAAMLYAGHLVHSDLDEEKTAQFSQKLFSRLQHMEKQVRDMLLFVKQELPLNEVVSLSELQHQLQEAAEVPLHTSHAVCEWINSHENTAIKCHSDALISALMNLVNNSIQASSPPPTIKIIFTELEKNEKNYVCIAINDKGEGMTAEQLNVVQDVFVTTKSQGTGLGLAVVKSVVKAHGGEFYLHSKKGEGTTASILLPIHTQTHSI